MSSKGGHAVTTLRFPEFFGKPLHDVCLGDVTEEATSRNGNKLARSLVMGVRKDGGIVPMEERLVAGDIARYKNVRKNWFAYNPMRLNIGSIARWQGGEEVLVSPDYVVFRCHLASLLPEYLDHFRSSRQWEAFTNGSGDGGVRIRIYYRDLARMRLLLPPVGEQQKISNCLSSIDALIAAEADKLEALKDHKKGLIQQLFPAPGETSPRLRFPEFHDEGDWKDKRLGDVGRVQMCKRIFKEQTGPLPGIPFYKIGTFGGVTDTYISNEIYMEYIKRYPFPKKGNVLISAAGTIGKAIIYDGEPAYFQDSNIVWLENDNKVIDDVFLYYVYQMIDWKPNIGTISRLYNDDILQARVSFPNVLEQQKIAAVLTAADNLILTQGEKMKALKAHKLGLMRQLFPIANEVTG